MSDASTRKVLRRIERDIAQHEAEIRKLREFAAYIQGDEAQRAPVTRMAPTSIHSARSARKTHSGPTLRQRVERCFASVPADQSLTVPEIADCLTAAGWEADTENRFAILRRVLRELAADGVLLRPDDRRYQAAEPSLLMSEWSPFKTGEDTGV